MSAPAATAPLRPRGLLGSAISTDHKSIARGLLAVALVMFLGGGVMALIMRSELAQPGLQVVSTGSYNALFTMHGSTMIYAVVIPLGLALGVYLVPLQVGAAQIAGPRVALVGFWLFVFGAITMEAGWLTNGGPGRATWIGVAPLSEFQRTPNAGQDLWILGVGVLSLGQWLLALCVLFTALRKRAPGMTLLRMAPFTWSMVGTTLMGVFAFPVLVVLMGLLWWDRRNCCLFDGDSGPLNYQHLFWFYGHPIVYVMFFPFVGAVAEVFSAFCRRRLFGYEFFVGATILTFAGLSMAVWGHHMFTTGRIDDRYFSLSTHMIIAAAGVEYFDILFTAWRGKIRFTTAFLFAVTFMLQFLIGGLSGIWVASPPLDFQAHNSYIVIAHFHYTLFAGSMFGAFAAIYYWFPKWTGAMLREGLGKLQLALMIVGTNITFGLMFAVGEDGMPRRIADYRPSDGWGTLNLLETIGAGVIALGILVFLINLWVSLRRRIPAGSDPWGGPSLEWATSSPPPEHNFDALPPIRTYAPLYDLAQEEWRERGLDRSEVPA